MRKINILWVDDEIDLLKPHILFLENKGYNVFTSNNGNEALDILKTNPFDIVFLDEQMPGISGIETLGFIKSAHPNIPVIMITKSEEEKIMEDAIGSNISDYLIKPVNPNQILLCLKKNLENKKLISEKTAFDYQQEFRGIGLKLSENLNTEQWIEIYKKLVYWELELEKSNDSGMIEVLKLQKEEANNAFSKFIEKNYFKWLHNMSDDIPIMSHTLVKKKLFPLLKTNKPVFFLVIDNFRYDQWKTFQPVLEEYFRVIKDEIYYSILPTTTQYARNALFAGLMPSEIEKKYPKYWVNETDNKGRNEYENELFSENLKRFGINIKHSYNKVTNLNAGKKLVDTLPNLLKNKLNIIVYNFIDMLSHARTEMEIIRELANDESAYRSLTFSWFEHSHLFQIIKFISENNAELIITTDHGSIRTYYPVKVVGDKSTNTNLRYKIGKSLNYNKKEVFEVVNPDDAYLPKNFVSAKYIFAKKNNFFAYPNNYNYYVNYYKNTFQHGGISLEEMLIPIIHLKAK